MATGEIFDSIQEEELLKILEKKDSESTKRVVRGAVRIFDSFCTEQNIDRDNEDLNDTLKKFYTGARSKTRELYSKKSMIAIRYGLQKHFEKENGVDIVHGKEFKEANKIFSAMLVRVTQEGKESVQHKTPLSKDDLIKLYTSFELGKPRGLQDKAFVDFLLYFSNRGRENLRALKKSDFIVNEQDGYIELKDAGNGRGSTRSDSDKGNRILRTSSPLCAFDSLSKYLSRLNPKCPFFFQRPKAPRETLISNIWYENIVIGKNNLGIKMKSLSKAYGLSREYTNLCLKVTPVSLLGSLEAGGTQQMAERGSVSVSLSQPILVPLSGPVLMFKPAPVRAAMPQPASASITHPFSMTGVTRSKTVVKTIMPKPATGSRPETMSVTVTEPFSVARSEPIVKTIVSQPLTMSRSEPMSLNVTEPVVVIKTEPCSSPVPERMDDIQEDHGIVPKIEVVTDAIRVFERASELRKQLREEKRVHIKPENLFLDMMEVYRRDPAIEQHKLTFCFQPHQFADDTTESHDDDVDTGSILVMLWEEAFRRHFTGNKDQIPVIDPSVSDDLFVILGRVLVHGLILRDYLPIKFSPACLSYLLTGKCSDRLLLTSLYRLMSESEKEVLENAMDEVRMGVESFSPQIDHGVKVILGSYGCRKIPNPEELDSSMADVAKCYLIRQIYWSLLKLKDGIQVAGSVFLEGISEEDILAVYQALAPSVTAIIERLTYILSSDLEQNETEKKVKRFFEQYLYKLSKAALQRLLYQWCGFDCLCVSDLYVKFASESSDDNPVFTPKQAMICLPSACTSLDELRELLESQIPNSSLMDS